MNSFDLVEDVRNRLMEAVQRAREDLYEAAEKEDESRKSSKEEIEKLLHQCNTVKEYLGETAAGAGADPGWKVLYFQEAERMRLAREIHDGPAQLTAHALLRTEIAGRLLAKAGTPEAEKELAEAKSSIQNALTETRRLIYDFRPPDLEGRGLTEAAAVFLQEIEEQTGTTVIFRTFGEETRLRPELETALYRFIQEAVRNAVKHGRPERIIIRMGVENQRVKVSVLDDGAGFETAPADEYSFGLKGLQERMKLFGGAAAIESRPGRGTEITASIPIHGNEL